MKNEKSTLELMDISEAIRESIETKQNFAWHWVKFHKFAYEQTGNPLHVWFAFGHCRMGGIKFPEWVLRYFSSVAQEFSDLEKSPPSTPLPVIAEALKFKSPGRSGRKNVFRDYDRSDEVILALEVYRYLKNGHQSTYSWEHVAEKYNVSPKTVERAWKKHKESF